MYTQHKQLVNVTNYNHNIVTVDDWIKPHRYKYTLGEGVNFLSAIIDKSSLDKLAHLFNLLQDF